MHTNIYMSIYIYPIDYKSCVDTIIRVYIIVYTDIYMSVYRNLPKYNPLPVL